MLSLPKSVAKLGATAWNDQVLDLSVAHALHDSACAGQLVSSETHLGPQLQRPHGAGGHSGHSPTPERLVGDSYALVPGSDGGPRFCKPRAQSLVLRIPSHAAPQGRRRF